MTSPDFLLYFHVTYRQHLISLIIGWAVMIVIAVLVLGTDTIKVVVIFGGGLVVLSLALAFVLEHGGRVIRKWRVNAEAEEAFGGYARNGKLLFTGIWPRHPVYDLETGEDVTGSITGGSYMDAQRISDEEAEWLLRSIGVEIPKR